jgi:hypothetical protein
MSELTIKQARELELDLRFAKGPKWASEERIRLLRKIEDLERAIARRDGEFPDAAIFGDRYQGSPRPVGKEGDTIRFQLSGEPYDYLDVCLEGGKLTFRGDGLLSIMPQSSNTAAVKLVRR